MPDKEFCLLILSHGRPYNVKTITSIQKAGYTGDWYIVIDSDDPTIDDYHELYGEKVVVFDKADAAALCETADNTGQRNVVIYARNISWKIAEELGYAYFMQLDDDYATWQHCFNSSGVYEYSPVKSMSEAIDHMLTFFKSVPNLLSLCISQGGDHIGGALSGSNQKIGLTRKAMNTFIFAVDRPFRFVGKINEDVNTYVRLGNTGSLFFTTNLLKVTQMQTQLNDGGLTEAYLDQGTYVKSFYSIIYSPSCVKIGMMGESHQRIHHRVAWNNAVPKVISQIHKKSRTIT